MGVLTPAADLQRAVDAAAQLGTAKAAANLLKLNYETFRHRLVEAKRRGITATQVVFDQHPSWLKFGVKNGVVLVGSDAHYWPNYITTAHKAFVQFCEEMQPKVVVLNGDVLDFPSISRHAMIGWEERPSVESEIAGAKDRLAEIERAAPTAKRYWPLGNHDCLDPQTECLTQRGWLRHQDIRADDLVLSLVAGQCKWTPIDEVVRFPFQGDLVRVEKTRMSMAVTPNHRVFLKRLNWRSKHYDIEEYRRADDLPSSFDLPTAGDSVRPGITLSDDQITLVGWLITDGGYQNNNASIYQSKPANIPILDSLLQRLGLTYSRYERQREARIICGRLPVGDPLPSMHFFIHVESSRQIFEWLPDKRRLPQWAHDLDSRQFAVLLDAIVAGDGVWDGSNPAGKTCCVIYGRHEILGDIQSVAVAHGWRARLATDNRGDFRLCLTKEPKIRVERPEVFSEPFEGTVWCLRVAPGNFMVRRNGCAYFTGNSRFESRLAAVAPEYAKVHGVHLKDNFPNWIPCWSVLINDDVVIKHRLKGGIHATHNNTLWAGKTVVTGHLHSLKSTPLSDYNGTRWGVDTGTLADVYGPQFQAYTENNPANWRSGFAVLTFVDGMLLDPELVRVIAKRKVSFRGKIITV